MTVDRCIVWRTQKLSSCLLLDIEATSVQSGVSDEMFMKVPAASNYRCQKLILNKNSTNGMMIAPDSTLVAWERDLKNLNWHATLDATAANVGVFKNQCRSDRCNMRNVDHSRRNERGKTSYYLASLMYSSNCRRQHPLLNQGTKEEGIRKIKTQYQTTLPRAVGTRSRKRIEYTRRGWHSTTVTLRCTLH